jgi:uncharacterized protein YjbI with pentapeptide repeats
MLDCSHLLADAYQLYSSFVTNGGEEAVVPPPRKAENKDFGEDFAGALIRSPLYSHCRFNQSRFKGSDAASTQLHSCGLYDCTMEDGDFRFCDFDNTTITQKHGKSHIKSCNFSYGNYINCTFAGTQIEGTSFREMLIKDTKFLDCSFDYCSFERTAIKGCTFENVDFSRITFRYCDFEDVCFDNVTFHILDLAKNYGLITQLQKNRIPLPSFTVMERKCLSLKRWMYYQR